MQGKAVAFLPESAGKFRQEHPGADEDGQAG
jgi:hypothetical protein